MAQLGTKGFDNFTLDLYYVSFNNLFLVPTFHMLLYGVVKSFWSHAFVASYEVLSTKAKKLMTQRSGGIIITDDFTSRYSDIVKHNKNWKIHDWLNWVDIWGNFILKGIELKGTIPTDKQRAAIP